MARLLTPGSQWVDKHGAVQGLRPADLRIVSPYNAQVSRLAERFADRGVRVGTVDKFQGQEAPVVIYSMATSRPEDAPRGMEFLYSLNRLNVATSRARCAAIIVALAGPVRAGVPHAAADAAGERAVPVQGIGEGGVSMTEFLPIIEQWLSSRLNRPPRRYGKAGASYEGFSDGVEGVQWNAGIERDRKVVTVGVNLEGMKYDGWPIATLLLGERRTPRLPNILRRMPSAAFVEVWLERDAWQAAAR